MEHAYYVYILSNSNGILYTGMTNDIYRRMKEHQDGNIDGFTKKYKINRLVFFEEYQYVEDAIAREKQIKGWDRRKRLDLIRTLNPKFEDLSKTLFGS